MSRSPISLRAGLAALTILVAFAPASARADSDSAVADRAAILGKVHEIGAAGGLPGDVVAFGDTAFVVITGRVGKDRLPLVAAARCGTSGRVVIAGHESFFGGRGLANGDNLHLALGIAAWAGGRTLAGLRVGLVQQDPALASELTNAGCLVTRLQPGDLPGALDAIDVCWIDQASLGGAGADARISAISVWVKSGRGLVVTGPAWGWLQLHPGATLASDHPANRLLRPFGLAFGPGSLEATDKQGFTIDDGVPPLSNAATALGALQDSASGARSLDPAQAAQITRTIDEALGALPDDDPFVRRVDALCAAAGDVVPTPQSPVTLSMVLPRLAAHRYMSRLATLPPERVTAHPAAASFPGNVPAGALRERQTLLIDTGTSGWHGTGLYAAPGDLISLSVPSTAVGKGLAMRIGAHTDTLWEADRWERFPEITVQRPIDAAQIAIACPFGGLVFVMVPEGCHIGTITATIAGAVPTPRYVRGEDTPQDWRDRERDAPGPWAELQGNSVALIVPSTAIRDLDDPEALMARWDTVMDQCYTFFAAPRRARPERYCVDRQISAGYMHSGYPIMVHEDVAKAMCDIGTLQGAPSTASWGLYHEMGHNFQQPEWTWADFGEVTNNLFSLYASEKLNHAESGAHPDMTLAKMGERERVVAAAPGAERYYARDPWYPLTMFWLLRHAFGWEPFTRLFAEFRSLPEAQRPHSEQEKHDQFLTRFSRLTGHNLAAYLTAWGVELSPAAKSATSKLPPWMPDNWPQVR